MPWAFWLPISTPLPILQCIFFKGRRPQLDTVGQLWPHYRFIYMLPCQPNPATYDQSSAWNAQFWNALQTLDSACNYGNSLLRLISLKNVVACYFWPCSRTIVLQWEGIQLVQFYLSLGKSHLFISGFHIATKGRSVLPLQKWQPQMIRLISIIIIITLHNILEQA